MNVELLKFLNISFGLMIYVDVFVLLKSIFFKNN